MSGGKLNHIRQADWLDSRRVRGYAVILGIASLALLVNSYLKAMGPDGTDFLAFWGAGHVTVSGDPAAAYDLATQERVQTGTGSTGWFAFVNPPPFLFAAAPFGALPFPLAWIAWVAVTFTLWAWASIRAFPRFWPIILVFPGALLAAGHAQTGLLTGALLVGGVAAMGTRPVFGGMLLGALIIKPHLAILIPFWLAGARQWRAFVAAGASAAGLLLLSWLVFGNETMLGYMDSWQASAAIMRGDDPEFYLRMASIYSQLRLFATVPLALAANALVALCMGALAFLSARRFGGDMLASGAFVLAATALTSPYLFSYDLPFLILPVLWLVREGLREGFRSYEKLGLVVLFAAPYATRAAALPLEINLMALASLALVWLIWSRGGGRSYNSSQS
ncbi:glycosyltransferase family 87 protein [Aurantiacibacter sp. D1-12]|uniref:glycosyltransferase family 87 protein n=1 Tax=Aurantiacibacter sp. D1-12 TaxID=2993658 RepID=UPI00237CB0F6|nr:glycosyltransferase family 87 protein [Aurantiacibacter sp. D1-12]MDE1467565.1 glycosyltransferase family 87 protein [Aurantiacibacter sp. D1-12]